MGTCYKIFAPFFIRRSVRWGILCVFYLSPDCIIPFIEFFSAPIKRFIYKLNKIVNSNKWLQ